LTRRETFYFSLSFGWRRKCCPSFQRQCPQVDDESMKPMEEKNTIVSTLVPPQELDERDAAAFRTVTRSDIAIAIAERTPKLSLPEAAQVLDCILQTISDALSQEGGSVKLRGFGAFCVSEAEPLRGRGLVLDENGSIRRRKSVTFKASPGLVEGIEKSAYPGDAARLPNEIGYPTKGVPRRDS
jgi:nucleoid DNA-binding protein